MLPAYLNIRDVDKRVREAVVRLNRLSYVVTISSCEGHVYTGLDGLIPWELNGGWITIQTDGSYEARQFVGNLKELCDRYDFARIFQHTSSTEEEINRRIKSNGARVYGFKFPLGKDEYSIVTQSEEGSKESVITSKRKVNEFWAELTLELKSNLQLSLSSQG